MIKLIDEGIYKVVKETKQKNILVVNYSRKYEIEDIDKMRKGNYREYQVKDEPGLSDGIHLELHISEGRWQGYLLKGKNQFILTSEIITKIAQN